MVQIASKHNILPQNLQNWKKTFLANAEIAMDPFNEFVLRAPKTQTKNQHYLAV
jgi:putative transposase